MIQPFNNSENLPASFRRMALSESSRRSEEESDEDQEDDDHSEESDWEQEITQDGSVSFIEPMTNDEATRIFQKSPTAAAATAASTTYLSSNPISNSHARISERDNGKKLSRLVRRRESKRDRNSSCNVVLKTPGGTDGLNNPKSPLWRTGNSHESSDNDSSTYGQIKTFEAFFETTNLDRSVASPAPTPRIPTDNSINPGGKDEATEIHEVTLKFQAKRLKAQIPHFQMLLHGDNPANRALLLEALLGIIPQVKPLHASESNSAVIDNSVVIAKLVPQGLASQWGDKLRCGDIIRSLDGHHVTLDTVNTYLLNKLTKSSSSSTTGKVKLILQRPMGSPSTLAVASSHFGDGPPSEAELQSQRNAIAKRYTTLDDHAWALLNHANVMAAIITQGNDSAMQSSDMPSVVYLLQTQSSSTAA